MKREVWTLALAGWVLAAGCEAPEPGADAVEARRQAVTGSPFKPYTATPVGSNAAAVAIGDLDGDGRNDVALLTSTCNTDPANDYMVHVFLQDIDGSLKPRVKYPVGARRGDRSTSATSTGTAAPTWWSGLNGGTSQIGVLLQNATGTLDRWCLFDPQREPGEGRRLQRGRPHGHRRNQLGRDGARRVSAN